MSAYQCWLTQKEQLQASLQASQEVSATVYLIRRALAQVEQITMSEQQDDSLRQQVGILFSCIKTSLTLLEVPMSTSTWVAQPLAASEKPKQKRNTARFLLPACAVQAAVGVFAYVKGEPLLWIPLAGALIATIIGWLQSHRSHAPQLPQDRVKVTITPDRDRLLQAIDAQMKAIDRFANDFAYLNEQITLRSASPETQDIALLAELMQAVCECEGESGEDAVAAARLLLAGRGVRAEAYNAEIAGNFTILPSLNKTRTLVPALVSQKDGSLLFRGTAAVQEATQ